MGEYALHNGSRIKIGSCEDMYYLRHSQRATVGALPGNVNPVRDAHELRFRFPWPDEDHIAPGRFDGPYGRSIPVEIASIPPEVEHYAVQFSARAGYLISLPCPEGPNFPASLPFHRNGFRGKVHLCGQKPTEDGRILRLILRCGGCESMWRVETWKDAEPVIVALRSEADRMTHDHPGRAFWHAVADRAAAGYGR